MIGLTKAELTKVQGLVSMSDENDRKGTDASAVPGEKSNTGNAARTAQDVIRSEMSKVGSDLSLSEMDSEASWGDRIIHDLTDVIEEGSPKAITVAEFDVELMKKVAEVAERIAREIVPEIAERVIREEIERLKSR